MWNFIADSILKYRLYILLLIIGITIFMGFRAAKVEWSYSFASIVPSYDEELIFFKEFKKTYGEDGNLLVIGLQSDKIYQLQNFNELYQLVQNLTTLKGVQEVIALPNLQYLEKDTLQKRFTQQKLFKNSPHTQAELDSILQFARSFKFYEGQLTNPKTNAMVLLVTIEKKVLDSKYRQKLVQNIMDKCNVFEDKTKITLHYAGIPIIRTVMTSRMGADLQLLLVLSVVVMAVILFWFFRSLKAVLVPILIIGILIIWTVGMVELFGFKINILTGLIPPTLVAIGIPNSVYLLNKYHQEYRRTRNKLQSLHYIIRHIGVVALMTNLTTAVGFFVFVFMGIDMLNEFGILASVSVLNTFVVSLVLLPIIFSYLPPPTNSELVHLYRRPLRRFLQWLQYTVFWRRKLTYIFTIILILVSIYGALQIKVVAFMVDDFPNESQTKQDLRFFERNFSGVMPLEIIINTGRPKGVMRLPLLRKIDEFEKELRAIPLVSSPISIVRFLKASRQAFYNYSPDFYALPNNQDKNFLLAYLKDSQSKDTTQKQALEAFVDSSGQSMRISMTVADIGSIRMDSLINQAIRPIIDTIFYAEQLPEKIDADFAFQYSEQVFQDFWNNSTLEVHITGTTLIFIKGNEYLVSNLKSSLLLAIVIIGALMAMLFQSFRMVIISIITNILPLLVTAGLMGYFGVPLKPSTALIFSISFGIAVDDSIHYLARYRQALLGQNLTIAEAVSLSLREMGAGMAYTSIILFCGFIIFTSSEFEGTNALGMLTGTTLIMAMLANLVLLPSLLLDFDRKRRQVGQKNKLMDNYENFYHEAEDEEINTGLIKVKDKE